MASSSTQPEEPESTPNDAAALAAAAFLVLHPEGPLPHAALAALREVPLSQTELQAGSNKRANNVIKAVRKHLTDEAGRPAPKFVVGGQLDVRRWVPAPRGQEGTWAGGEMDSAFAEFNWQYWLRHMPEDQLEAILDGHGVQKVEVRCVPGCEDPHPGMGGSLWDIVISRDDDAQVWVHPSQKGPTVWSNRSPKARAAAFAAVGKKGGLQKKLEALYEEPRTMKEAARQAAGVPAPAREPVPLDYTKVPHPKQPPPENLQLYGPMSPDPAFAESQLLRGRGAAGPRGDGDDDDDEWTNED